jgi:diaminopimelate decarboxylase
MARWSRHGSAIWDCKVILEPGRLIVANAGVLVTEVIYVKDGGDKTFVIVDAAMNDLIRPTLYDAWHEVRPVQLSAASAPRIRADIVGPVCESGDYLAKDREMTAVRPAICWRLAPQAPMALSRRAPTTRGC